MRRTRLHWASLIACVSYLAALSPVWGDPRAVTVSLVVFSDIYEMGEKNGRGGFARVAAAISAERARSQNVIVAHAGDTISPSLMSAFDKGAHIIDLINRIKPDVFVPGNHEFDFGEAVFRTRMSEARFPLLAANLRDANGGMLDGFADNKIFEFGGVKIGVFGLTDDESARRSTPGSLKFSPTIATAKTQAAALRAAGADLVVAVSHSAWPDDIRLANLGLIDVVLSGHDHNLFLVYDGKSVIAETQSDGANVVAVDLNITLNEGPARSVTWTPKFRVIDTADVAPDASIAQRVAELQAALDRDLDRPVGTTTTAMDSRKASVRGQETAIGNFIADAMRLETNADVAIVNGGSIRGDRLYDAGAVLTRKDIFKELPFGNKVVLLELSGKDLRDILENAVRTVGRGEGRFGQLSGVRIKGRKDGVPGSKLTSIEVAGAALDETRLYKIATNDFISDGKEGFEAFTRGRWLITPVEGKLLVTVVMDAIQKTGSIAPVVDGRILLE